MCSKIGCKKFHYLGEARRFIFDKDYSAVMCPRIIEGECFYDEQCRSCHTYNELYYHLDVFKK